MRSRRICWVNFLPRMDTLGLARAPASHGDFELRPPRALLKMRSVESLIVAAQQPRPHKQQHISKQISKQISSTAQQYSFWGVIIRASGASNNIVLETRTGDNSAQSVSNAPTKPERGVIARICRYRVVIKSNNSAHFCLDFIAKTNRGVVRGRG